MTIGVFAPEIISALAASELVEARGTLQRLRFKIEESSLREKREGLPELSLTHGYFVNMRVIRVQLHESSLPHYNDDTHWESSYPNSQVLCRIIDAKKISLAKLSSDEIENRLHGDAVIESIAMLQSVWLVTQIIARKLSGLPITKLELATSGYVFCSIVTYGIFSSIIDIHG